MGGKERLEEVAGPLGFRGVRVRVAKMSGLISWTYVLLLKNCRDDETLQSQTTGYKKLMVSSDQKSLCLICL